MGKGAPPASKEGDQEEAEGSQESQDRGQAQLSEGGSYISPGVIELGHWSIFILCCLSKSIPLMCGYILQNSVLSFFT